MYAPIIRELSKFSSRHTFWRHSFAPNFNSINFFPLSCFKSSSYLFNKKAHEAATYFNPRFMISTKEWWPRKSRRGVSVGDWYSDGVHVSGGLCLYWFADTLRWTHIFTEESFRVWRYMPYMRLKIWEDIGIVLQLALQEICTNGSINITRYVIKTTEILHETKKFIS